MCSGPFHQSEGQSIDDADASGIEVGQPIQRTTTCTGLLNEYRPAA